MKICLDFETASNCDLSEAGAWRYAEDPTTEILCLAWVRGEHVWVWIPGQNDHLLIMLRGLAENPDVIFEAHNAAFEQAIWHFIMVGQLGMPPVPIERWDCTMARCAYTGAPMALDMAAQVLGVDEQKDKIGRKLTLSLSKPMTMVSWMEKLI
jgi:DNA polymerase